MCIMINESYGLTILFFEKGKASLLSLHSLGHKILSFLTVELLLKKIKGRTSLLTKRIEMGTTYVPATTGVSNRHDKSIRGKNSLTYFIRI